MRRGFASAADRQAAAVRAKLRLDVHDRLDPRVLSAEYDILVVSITDLVGEGADPSSIHQLTVVDRRAFSAGTILVGTTRLIIFNPAHSGGRLANSLTHEIAHLLLKHNPGPAIGPGGCRVWDQEMEDEADLLAAILLVPRDAALARARVGLPQCHRSRALRRQPRTDAMAHRSHRGDPPGPGRRPPARPHDPAAVQGGFDRASCLLRYGVRSDLTVRQWQAVLAACGRSLSAGSVTDLAACVQQSVAHR